MHVLFVLEERSVQLRQGIAGIGAQIFGRYVVGDQEPYPVERLRSGGLLLQSGTSQIS